MEEYVHMPLDSISQARLQLVFPVLAEKVRTMAMMLEQEGIEIRVVQGLRTIAEQDALYAQGRTVPGKIVTNCKGGFSWHNFGLAIDACPSLYGPDKLFSPDWNSEHKTWKRMEAVGQSLGLECGAFWEHFQDNPHMQYTGRFPVGAPTDEVRKLAENGLQAVWDVITDSLK